MKKKETKKSLLIAITDNVRIRRYILDIVDLQMFRDDKDQVKVTLPVNLPKCIKSPVNVMITYTDDPTMRRADDWASLGCSRMRFTLNYATKIQLKDELQLVTHNIFFEREFVVPER